MDIKLEKMFNKSSKIGAERERSMVEATTSYWVDSIDEGVRSIVSFRTGSSATQTLITSTEARKLAEILNAHADEVEALTLAVSMAKEAA